MPNVTSSAQTLDDLSVTGYNTHRDLRRKDYYTEVITSYYSFPELRELRKLGIRDKVKVLIGGVPITADFGKEIGVDYAAEGAAEGMRVARQRMNEGRHG